MEIERLWQEHQGKILLFIRSKVPGECDAKDILQQAFLKAKVGHRSVRDERKLLNWIYQVTRNAIMDHYRSRRRLAELPEELAAPPKETNNWRLISRCVRPFIEELPPLYRRALILSEIEGLDQKRVARKLGISLSSAKARILRGRQKLRKKFDDCCIFECGPRGARIHSDAFAREERDPA